MASFTRPLLQLKPKESGQGFQSFCELTGCGKMFAAVFSIERHRFLDWLFFTSGVGTLM
jgi:hypothetical protein